MTQYSRYPVLGGSGPGNYATKVTGAVPGDLAGLDVTGNLTDSGIAASTVSGYNTRITTLEGIYVQTTRFYSVSSGTSGTVTLPPSAVVILNNFNGTVDAVVTTIANGHPTFQHAYTAAGAIVGTTFDASGNYVLSGTPSAYPVAIVYTVRQTQATFDSTSTNIIGTYDVENIKAPSVVVDGQVATFSGTTGTILSATSVGDVSTSTTGMSVTGGTGAVLGSGVTVNTQTASTSQPGLLSSADWNTFNGKQNTPNVVSVSTAYTVAAGVTFVLADTTGGAFSITLPPPSTKIVILIKDKAGTTGANPITLVRNGSELLEGLASSRILTGAWDFWRILSDGTNWYLV